MIKVAVDVKYGKVTLERGTIGELEPVVVFRARDALAIKALAVYADFCQLAGSPREHLEGLDEAVRAFNVWQLHNGTKIPGTNGGD